MAGTNASKVVIGLLEQSKTVGALMRGPVITNIPATFDEALAAIANFASCGYLTDEGPTLTTEIDTEELREHNGTLVRKPISAFDATVEANIMQADADGWKMVVGEENVTVTPATTGHGEQLRIKLGAHLSEPQAWALRIKDGDYRMIVLVPNGQLTSELEISFVAGEPITLPASISGYDDSNGETVYIYTDDGQKLSTPPADATLSALTIGALALTPTFDKDETEYAVTTTDESNAVNATATASGAGVVIVANGNSIASGGTVTWGEGENIVAVTVTNGSSSKTYTVTVTKGE